MQDCMARAGELDATAAGAPTGTGTGRWHERTGRRPIPHRRCDDSGFVLLGDGTGLGKYIAKQRDFTAYQKTIEKALHTARGKKR